MVAYSNKIEKAARHRKMVAICIAVGLQLAVLGAIAYQSGWLGTHPHAIESELGFSGELPTSP